MLIGDIKKIGGSKLFEYYNAEGRVRAIRPREEPGPIPESSRSRLRTELRCGLAASGPGGPSSRARDDPLPGAS